MTHLDNLIIILLILSISLTFIPPLMIKQFVFLSNWKTVFMLMFISGFIGVFEIIQKFHQYHTLVVDDIVSLLISFTLGCTSAWVLHVKYKKYGNIYNGKKTSN